jgi:hypothetical protein
MFKIIFLFFSLLGLINTSNATIVETPASWNEGLSASFIEDCGGICSATSQGSSVCSMDSHFALVYDASRDRLINFTTYNAHPRLFSSSLSNSETINGVTYYQTKDFNTYSATEISNICTAQPTNASAQEVVDNCMGINWENICNYTNEAPTACANPNFAVELSNSSKKLYFYEKGTPTAFTNPNNILTLNGETYLFKTYNGFNDSHLANCSSAMTDKETALAACQGVEPNCNISNTLSTACNGTTSGNGAIYLSHGPTATDGGLQLKMNGIPNQSWDIDYTDIGVQGCVGGSSDVGDVNDAIEACSGKLTVSDCGNIVTNRLCSGTAQNGYFLSTPLIDASQPELGVAFVLSGTGSLFIDPAPVGPTQINAPLCPAPKGNITDAVSACNGKITSSDCGNTVTDRMCSSSFSDGYFISQKVDAAGDVAIELHGTGNKLLIRTAVNPEAVSVVACSAPEGNIAEAINACKGRVALSDCGTNFTDRACSTNATLGNGYLISTADNSLGGVDIYIKGVGSKVLASTMVNPFDVQAPNCPAPSGNITDAITACTNKVAFDATSCGEVTSAVQQVCSGSTANGYAIDVILGQEGVIAAGIVSGAGEFSLDPVTLSSAQLAQLNIVLPNCPTNRDKALVACSGVIPNCGITGSMQTSCNGGSFYLEHGSYNSDEVKLGMPGQTWNTTYGELGIQGCNLQGLENIDYSDICGGLVSNCSTQNSSSACSLPGFSIGRTAYNSTNNTGGDITVLRPDNTVIALTPASVGAQMCISDNQHFTNAIEACKSTVSQLSNSCPASGAGWNACSDNNYQYSINSWDENTNTGGTINLKIPNGQTRSVSRPQVGANQCLSAADRVNAAISACAGVVTSCPNSDFVYMKRSCNASLGITLLNQNEANYFVSREGYDSNTDTGGTLSLFYTVKGGVGYTGLRFISAGAINAAQCTATLPPATEKIINSEDVVSPVEMHAPTQNFSF